MQKIKEYLKKFDKWFLNANGINEDNIITVFAIKKLDDGQFHVTYKESLSRTIYNETYPNIDSFLKKNNASNKVIQNIPIT